jgi:hypothetical protein
MCLHCILSQFEKLGAFQSKAAIEEAKKKPPEGGFLDQTWQVIK